MGMRDRDKEDKGAGDEQSGSAIYKARFTCQVLSSKTAGSTVST